MSQSLSSFTLSFTAPRFSLKDLKEEQRSRSYEENETIWYEQRGFAAIPAEYSATKTRRQAQEAVLHALDREHPGLVRDMKRCPDLRTEGRGGGEEEDDGESLSSDRAAQQLSLLLPFIRCCEEPTIDDGGSSSTTTTAGVVVVDDVARRLTNYWNARRKLFGARAVRPMTNLTGCGALDLDEIRLLVAVGGIMKLPNDPLGRSVLYVHPSKYDDYFSHHHRQQQQQRGSGERRRNQQRQYATSVMLRHFFYVLSLAVQDDVAQRHGIVLLLNMQREIIANYSRKGECGLFALIRDCVPVRVRAIHFCCPALKSLASITVPMSLWIMKPKLRRHVLVHAGCPGELGYDLQQYGLLPEHLVRALGGSLPDTWFQEWILRQQQQQQQLLQERRQLQDQQQLQR